MSVIEENMKRYGIFIIVLLLTFLTCSLFAIDLTKGTEDLKGAVRSSDDPQEFFPVILIMSEQYDSQQLYSDVQGMDKALRREYAIRTLSSFSEYTQADLKTELSGLEKTGSVKDVRYLWITNAIGLNATKEALLQLDGRKDIDRIEYDPFRKVLIDSREEPLSNSSDEYDNNDYNTRTSNPQGRDRTIVYNLNIMNVPDVWDQGFYGSGAIVAVLDTGVNYNHTDIINQMWTHPDYPNHGYNFVNNNHNTMDFNGHGSHCAGTVAGDGTSGTQTGAAPHSQIMALAVLDSNGSGQQSGVWAAIQFSITYGADVMSISLGWLHAWNPDRVSWRNVMNNALSSGITASVAAGNEGNQQHSYPVPSNVRTPGDCPPPWLHYDQVVTGGTSAVISVGATNSADQIASFSSRGPVTWQGVANYNDYPYNPGMGLIRPDIVAPGVNVVSIRHNSNTGYRQMSGTSMAAPNNAGVLALMISKDHTLLPEEISQIIEESAHPLSATKSNTYGSGRVDALAAINMVTAENPPNPPINPYPPYQSQNIPFLPTLTWSNGGGASVYYVYFGTDNPPGNIVNGWITETPSYQITELLSPTTTYYWRIDALNPYGLTEGNVWTFTTALPVSESFETGDFSSYNWQFTTAGAESAEWFITSDESFSGVYSARSGEIGNTSITGLFITLDVVEDGVISFYHKTSTDENDFLRFMINNTIIGFWSGESGWTFESFPVPAGTHTFRWLYMKGATGSAGEDAVWIDDITFPPGIPTIAPDYLDFSVELESIHLNWGISQRRDQAVLLGYNVYQAIDQNTSYTIHNDGLVQDEEYFVPLTHPGNHYYYVTAVYDVGVSDPSDVIEVYINPSPEEPVITPSGGVFEGPVAVTIEADDQEVSIHYTLDGNEPNSQSILYTEPILISESLILNVRAFKEGHCPGEIITHEYFVTSSADEDIVEIVATDLRVYPNPFTPNSNSMRNNPYLNIDFTFPEEISAEDVHLDVYNIRGQVVKSFRLGNVLNRTEKMSVGWDLTDNRGRKIGSGIYFIKMNTGKEVLTRKIMIVK